MAKIAIIGGGIAGLSAAFLLQNIHEITLYEAEPLLGGHSRTLEVEGRPVDTGFIVFNKPNYPHLCGLFETLGVTYHKSDMSFGVHYGDGFDYAPSSLQGLFCDWKLLIQPRYWRMLIEMLRFFRAAPKTLETNNTQTLGQYLAAHHYSPWFIERFIVPMGAAIWSVPTSTMMQFPFQTFVRFFVNHALLSATNQHQWFTVTGGSRAYVRKLEAALTRVKLIKGVGVKAVEGLKVTLQNGASESFEKIIFACHADTSASLLQNQDYAAKPALNVFKFQENAVILHKDESFMPKRKTAWASWIVGKSKTDDRLAVTYWMNNLQKIEGDNLFVTLNPEKDVQPSKTLNVHHFHHPIFDASAINAQGAIAASQGENGYYFAGAWLRYGFHEDGILSAVRVANLLGVKEPWANG